MDEQNDKQEKKKFFLVFAGSLLFYCVFGIILVKLFQVLLGMEVKNVWTEGFQIGLISWLVVMVLPLFVKKKRK